jgi:hypothetical protein
VLEPQLEVDATGPDDALRRDRVHRRRGPVDGLHEAAADLGVALQEDGEHLGEPILRDLGADDRAQQRSCGQPRHVTRCVQTEPAAARCA